MDFKTDDLKKFTDAQLCKMAKDENEVAFNELVCRYSGLVDMKSSLFFNSFFDRDDFFQEGTLALLNAVKSYNSACGTSFKTYASVCIERRFISLVKAQNCKKHIPKKKLVSMSTIGESCDSVNLHEDSNPADLIIEKEGLSLKKEYIKNVLSPLEYNVLSLHIAGYKYKKIAKMLNIPLKAVDNALWRVKGKLK